MEKYKYFLDEYIKVIQKHFDDEYVFEKFCKDKHVSKNYDELKLNFNKYLVDNSDITKHGKVLGDIGKMGNWFVNDIDYFDLDCIKYESFLNDITDVYKKIYFSIEIHHDSGPSSRIWYYFESEEKKKDLEDEYFRNNGIDDNNDLSYAEHIKESAIKEKNKKYIEELIDLISKFIYMVEDRKNIIRNSKSISIDNANFKKLNKKIIHIAYCLRCIYYAKVFYNIDDYIKFSSILTIESEWEDLIRKKIKQIQDIDSYRVLGIELDPPEFNFKNYSVICNSIIEDLTKLVVLKLENEDVNEEESKNNNFEIKVDPRTQKADIWIDKTLAAKNVKKDSVAFRIFKLFEKNSEVSTTDMREKVYDKKKNMEDAMKSFKGYAKKAKLFNVENCGYELGFTYKNKNYIRLSIKK